MKKATQPPDNNSATKKGYNEKNPSEPHGAFPPASNDQNSKQEAAKSNTADKKKKEDQQ